MRVDEILDELNDHPQFESKVKNHNNIIEGEDYFIVLRRCFGAVVCKENGYLLIYDIVCDDDWWYRVSDSGFSPDWLFERKKVYELVIENLGKRRL